MWATFTQAFLAMSLMDVPLNPRVLNNEMADSKMTSFVFFRTNIHLLLDGPSNFGLFQLY